MHKLSLFWSGDIYVRDTPTNVSAGMKLISEARENRKHVLDAAATIEAQVSTIILHHFFPDRSAERRREFDAMVLRSEWCSFAAKRKLIHRIITGQRLLTGKDNARYEKLLKDVMSHRNAFVHGDLSTDTDSVFVSYFEGSPKKRELTDDFWKQLEQLFADAFWFTHAVADRSGASQNPNGSGRSIEALQLEPRPTDALEVFPKPPSTIRVTYSGDDLP